MSSCFWNFNCSPLCPQAETLEVGSALRQWDHQTLQRSDNSGLNVALIIATRLSCKSMWSRDQELKLQTPNSSLLPQHCVILTWQVFGCGFGFSLFVCLFVLHQLQKELSKSCSSFYDKLSSLPVRFKEREKGSKEIRKKDFSFKLLSGWKS